MPQFDFDHSNSSVIKAPLEGKSFNTELTGDNYKHSVVSSQDYSADMMLTGIEGAPYNIDYYAQMLTSTEEPRAFDINLPAAFQQYQLISNYEIRLTDELSTDYSEKDNRLTLQGTALTYPGLKPNVGDMLIGDIGDGKAGLFAITSAVKKTRFEATCYQINFELVYEVDGLIEKQINDRVVKKTHFVKDYINFGMDPVLASDRYMASKQLKQAITDGLAEYLAEFYSYEYTTLLVPGNAVSTYDPFAVSFILTIFETKDHPLIGKIRQLNTDDPQLKKYIDIWSVLLRQQPRLLDNCFSQVQVVPARSFSRNVLLQTVAFSGIDNVVLPVTRKMAIDDVLGLTGVRLPVSNNAAYTPNQEQIEAFKRDGLKTIPDVEGSQQYIFSDEFYNTLKVTPGQSDFENLVKRYLNKEHLDYQELLKFFEQTDSWTSFQRYYLMPVLFMLLIYQLRSI